MLTKHNNFVSSANVDVWVEQPQGRVLQHGISVHSYIHTCLFYLCKYKVCAGSKEQVNSAGTVYMPEPWALKHIFVFGCSVS